MRIGKLDNDLLKKIVIDKMTYRRPEVKTRPGIGEDCAVIDFGAYDCVLSTDPITATSERIGSLAVNVSCNDIASNGVEPLGILLSVLLPPDTTEDEIAEIMNQAAEAAEKIAVEIIGGHTEITDVVRQPVITATAVGRVASKDTDTHVSEGDKLIVTKLLALEGTGIIAASHAGKLAAILSTEELDAANKMLDNVSVVADGVIAASIGVSGMHDITEGGVLGAVWEFCALNGVGASLRSKDMPVAAVTRKICAHFNIDPLRLISSGSMLIAAPKKTAADVIAALANAGIDATEIGEVTALENGVCMDGEVVAPPESDEVYRILT